MSLPVDHPARNWIKSLREPSKLPWVIALTASVCCLAAIHLPAQYYTQTLTRQLKQEQSRHQLATEVIELRHELSSFEGCIPEGTNVNAWRQYVVEPLLASNITLVSLEPGKKQILGPYEIVNLRLELRGTYQELDKYLEWLETNRRLLRIDSLSIAPNRGANDILSLQLTITGLMG